MEKYKIAIEFDDWSVVNPAFTEALQALEKLRENYPSFKVTMYTTPWETRYKTMGHLTNPEHKNKLQAMKKLHEQGWFEYAVHGLTHLPLEFKELDETGTEKRIVAIEKIFKEAELPYVKIFKAPNWYISKEAETVLKEHGYKVVKDGYYQWNLKDDVPKPQEWKGQTIIAHGHVQNGDGCSNGVVETAHKLRKLPADTDFHFISDVI